MSHVTTRNEANSIDSVAISAGAMFVGACLLGLVTGVSSAVGAALRRRQSESSPNTTMSLKSVSTLPKTSPAFGRGNRNDIESMRSEAFLQLAQQPYLISNPKEIESGVQKLSRSQNAAEVHAAYSEIVTTLENGHQQLFANSLLEASKRASIKIGFEKIEPLPSPLTSTLRFAGTDSLGRSIITEINAPLNGDARIETEVIGVIDGSCVEIVDAFDEALEAEGVRSRTPERKYTGGVCELAAVREFVSKNITPIGPVVGKVLDGSDQEVKLSRRLNRTSACLENNHTK